MKAVNTMLVLYVKFPTSRMLLLGLMVLLTICGASNAYSNPKIFTVSVIQSQAANQVIESNHPDRTRFGIFVSANQRQLAVSSRPTNSVFDDKHETGFVEIFDKSHEGNWGYRQTVYPFVPDSSQILSHEAFGIETALSDEWLAVGNPFVQVTSTKMGVVEMFQLQGNEWTRTQQLVAPDSSSLFGISVAIKGGFLVIGDEDYHSGSQNFVGIAHVFQLVENEWELIGVLRNPNPESSSQFGSSVAISNNVVIVGAHGSIVGSQRYYGSAYIYEYIDEKWKLTSTLIPELSTNQNWCGQSVSIRNDLALVGCPLSHNIGSKDGAAVVFKKSFGTWVQQEVILNPLNLPVVEFGWKVEIAEDYILVNSRYTDLDKIPSGMVFGFKYSDMTFGNTGALNHPFENTSTRFGWGGIASTGTDVIVGAYNSGESGQVFVFSPSWATNIDQIPIINPEIQVHPNPATTTLTIDLSHLSRFNPKYVTVFDILGRQVLKHNIVSNLTTLDVSGLTNGTYYGVLDNLDSFVFVVTR